MRRLPMKVTFFLGLISTLLPHPAAAWGQEMELKEFLNSGGWPSVDDAGVRFSESQAGYDKWLEFITAQGKAYEAYLKRGEEITEKLVKEHFTKTGEHLGTIGNPARTYPFCVDGNRPFLDRFEVKLKKTPLNWAERDIITTEDKKLPYKQTIDLDLENFMPFFKKQPDIPIVANRDGRPAWEHLLNGEDRGPFIQKITFSKIFSPAPPVGISFKAPWGSPEMPFWIHIIVHSRLPLEGLFIQAIGHPMGLPFGNFRDDFDCNPGNLGDKNNLVTKHNPHNPHAKANKDKLLQSKSDRINTIIPCKYSHGNNNGDMYPNVFAYGGRKSHAWTKKSEFRVHFTWSSIHCNYKTRVQFLVMAVQSFGSGDYETFLTSNYVLNQNNAAGSPPPYIKGPVGEYGWDDNMRCDEANVIDITQSDKSRVTLLYDARGSRLPIQYNGLYDACIVNDNDPKNFFADKSDLTMDANLLSVISGVVNGPPDKDGHPTINKELPNVKNAMANWEMTRKLAQICPPADICLNEDSSEGGRDTDYDDNGHPKGAAERIRKFVETIKESTAPTCQANVCKHPNETVPILKKIRFGLGSGGLLDSEDEDAKQQLIHGGTRFSEKYTQEFFRRGSLHFRKARGTHVWCMTLAWCILMAVGAFTARYYKETAGINPSTGSSVLGLGYWIWIHIFLFFLSLTFMWIGILETARFRQKPISCNSFNSFGEFALKNFCRWKKKIVRNHRKIGIAAAFCYHISLLISWARPVRKMKLLKCKIPLRKIFLWIHVLFAYIGKLVCIASVILFFAPKAQSICISIPIIVVFTEFVSIVFFAAGWIVQILEDSKTKKSRRVFPVLEAIETSENPPCYWCKMGMLILSSIVHFILFICMVVAVNIIYMKTDNKGTELSGAFEDDNHGIGGKCKIISAQTELEGQMKGYYYSKTASEEVE